MDLPPLRYPPAECLSADEEQALARAVRQQDRQMSTRARDRLIQGNLPVVRMAMRQLGIATEEGDDAFQEGVLGLIRAVDGFDPDRGYRFVTYALPWVRKGLLRYLEEQTRLIRFPHNIAEVLPRYYRLVERTWDEEGRAPTTAEIARGLGITLRRAASLERLPSSVSLSTPVAGEEEELTLGDVLQDPAPGPEEQAIQGEEAQRVREAVAMLPEEERHLIVLRFGLEDRQHRSCGEVGAILGFSTSTIQRWEREALVRLRAALAEAA